RGSLARIDGFDRTAGFLDLKQDIFIAVRHHGAFAQPKLLRRIGRRLYLHHPLPRELLEKLPADIARYLMRRGHDRAAVTWKALDELTDPYRLQQIRQPLPPLP